MNRLSARAVATAPPGRYFDGGGLMLYVKPNGNRSWVFRYSYAGRRRDQGLGRWPDVSLAEAREKALEARRLLADGRDPIHERRTRERAVPTFREAAEDYVKAHGPAWKSAKHRRQWKAALDRHADAVLGDLRVDEIRVDDVLRVLRPIWEEKTETASRVRQRIEKILDWCAVLGLRSRENPARWRGCLEAILPAKGKVHKVKHFRALPWVEVPAFMQRLKTKQGPAARALEFAILTAARSGEVRGATWAEIDLRAKTWTVPAERMKSGRVHRVPLAPEAIELLESLPRLEGVPFLFPSPVKGGPLSDMALSKVCRDLGVDAVPHGFRSSFRTWCSETTNYPREVAEAALAHVVQNQVEAAYRRGDLFTKRRPLMAAWARFVTTPPAAGEVVPIRSRPDAGGDL